MKLVINRKIWGTGIRGGRLYRKYADVGVQMCCMGILAKACGVSVGRLKDNGMLSGVYENGKMPSSGVLRRLLVRSKVDGDITDTPSQMILPQLMTTINTPTQPERKR